MESEDKADDKNDSAETHEKDKVDEAGTAEEFDPSLVQDNQNFDLKTVANKKKEGAGASQDVAHEGAGSRADQGNDEESFVNKDDIDTSNVEADDALVQEEELDFGEDPKEDLVSLQIEEAEIALVESKQQEEGTKPANAPTSEAAANNKKEEKPSTGKEEEG